MRQLTCGLVFVMAIVAMGPVLNAQEPAPFVAVRDCQINPGERGVFREAQRELLDYVVANPPFSDKRWSTGLDPLNDPHERFKHIGVPPPKQGDYAYLLHIVRSLKSR